ncbi:MAG: glycosyltransferase 87 family protein [Candidatus Cloacimonetes bacterium]|nr:glycosyltransferase 87 family protein [Candidatus Cloacimonadota bacterium]
MVKPVITSDKKDWRFYINSPKNIFYTILITGTIVSLVLCILTQGQTLENMLYRDREDYFMDYFNSIRYSAFGPYANFDVIYPAFMMIIYYYIGVVLKSFGVVFEDSSEGAFGLRDSIPGIASYFLITFVFLIILYLIIRKNLDMDRKEKIVFFLLILFSYPMLFTIDRGNSILWTYVFILLFLALYDSKKKNERYLSYVFLGIAVATKMYPAIFGLLVLNKSIENKKMKDLLICVFIVATLLFVPFIFTDGSFIGIIQDATEYSGYIWSIGHVNITGIVETTAYLIGIGSYPPLQTISSVISIMLMAIIIFIVIFDREARLWETITLLTGTLVLCAGVGAEYLLLYIAISAWYFVKEDVQDSRRDRIIAILMAVILVLLPGPWPFFSLGIPYFKAICLLMLILIIMIPGLKRAINNISKKFSVRILN